MRGLFHWGASCFRVRYSFLLWFISFPSFTMVPGTILEEIFLLPETFRWRFLFLRVLPGGGHAIGCYIGFSLVRAFHARQSFILSSLGFSLLIDWLRDDFDFLDTASGGVEMGG